MLRTKSPSALSVEALESREVPAVTAVLGAISISDTTPPIGADTTTGSMATTSAGARTYCRTGNRSTTATPMA